MSMEAKKTEKKDIVITLTDRPPVVICPDEWPVVAAAKRFDNQYEFQANRKWRLKVRRHGDGRAVVYGLFDTVYPGEADGAAGVLVPAGGDLPAAIRSVGERLGFDEGLIDECIGDLPAVSIDSAFPPVIEADKSVESFVRLISNGLPVRGAGGAVVVGEYTIRQNGPDTVIIITREGEGGAFKVSDLEPVIRAFYEKFF